MASGESQNGRNKIKKDQGKKKREEFREKGGQHTRVGKPRRVGHKHILVGTSNTDETRAVTALMDKVLHLFRGPGQRILGRHALLLNSGKGGCQ